METIKPHRVDEDIWRYISLQQSREVRRGWAKVLHGPRALIYHDYWLAGCCYEYGPDPPRDIFRVWSASITFTYVIAASVAEAFEQQAATVLLEYTAWILVHILGNYDKWFSSKLQQSLCITSWEKSKYELAYICFIKLSTIYINMHMICSWHGVVSAWYYSKVQLLRNLWIMF